MTTFEDGNVTEQAENRGNPQFDWNRLPPELKRHCIKKMDFKARTELRCSSKTERNLVDSLGKYQFDSVCIAMRFSLDGMLEITARNGDDEYLYKKCSKRTAASDTEDQKFQRFVNFMKQVLSCDITCLELEICRRDDHELFLDVLTNGPALSVKKLEFLMTSNELWVQILKHCDENELTDIEIRTISHLEETLFDIPQVINARRIAMRSLFFTAEQTFTLAMKWLEVNRNHPEVGKELKVRCISNPMASITEKLKDSVVRRHPTEDAIRVTTSDPSLHIWIYLPPRHFQLQMFIVPSDSEDPGFQKRR